MHGSTVARSDTDGWEWLVEVSAEGEDRRDYEEKRCQTKEKEI